MRQRLPGPVLLGFAEAFEEAYGDPATPRPYPRITPSRIGPVLLPFSCPHCAAVRSETVDPSHRRAYQDAARRFSWCPACRGRYVVNGAGMPLPEALPAGATCAPARVERGIQVLDGS
jgi:hypothetical protein